jgi:2-polyprenyl-6-methoxyphenol hydroxylase-like FAD-dependent oxidoreductase
LFVAAFLRRIGWQVDLYERSPVELVGRGVGIFASHPELLEALDKCGAGTVDVGVTSYGRITLDREGTIIARRPMLQIVTSWDRLRQLVSKAVDRQRFYYGHDLQRVEQDSAGVRAYFGNGRTAHADLLIACDGSRSTVRAQLAPNVQPSYAGYYLWRGAPNEADLSDQTRATLLPIYSFFLDDRLQVLGYPIPGAEDDLRLGHRRYNFAWFRVAEANELKAMLVDDQGRQHEFSVPPPLVRKDLIQDMRAAAETLLPPQFLDCLRHIEQPFFTPIYDFWSPNLVFGRVVLVGDAASTVRPHVGFGASKAAAEAQALAEALRRHDDVEKALAEYDAVRQPLGERIILHGRRLGTQLGVGIETDDDRRMAELLQNPDTILDWVAVPNFLATEA